MYRSISKNVYVVKSCGRDIEGEEGGNMCGGIG